MCIRYGLQWGIVCSFRTKDTKKIFLPYSRISSFLLIMRKIFDLISCFPSAKEEEERGEAFSVLFTE